MFGRRVLLHLLHGDTPGADGAGAAGTAGAAHGPPSGDRRRGQPAAHRARGRLRGALRLLRLAFRVRVAVFLQAAHHLLRGLRDGAGLPAVAQRRATLQSQVGLVWLFVKQKCHVGVGEVNRSAAAVNMHLQPFSAHLQQMPPASGRLLFYFDLMNHGDLNWDRSLVVRVETPLRSEWFH